jgi:PST family polysaccharide transporter
MVAPLLTIPYLARVLGPAGWGPVLAAQAFGAWLLLILEFGFELSGARAVARARRSTAELADVVHGVQSAKALLALSSLPLVCGAFALIPGVRDNSALLWWTLAFAVLRGFSPLWFYQGIEQVHGAVAVDSVCRAAAAFLVFAVVHGPEDGWRVIALQAVFSAVSVAILTIRLTRHVELRSPAMNAAIATLRGGSTIFACRAWSGLYMQANTLVLSALAGPAVVAFFGGAERLVRAAINLLQPLTQAFLPRLSFLEASDPAAARKLVRHSLLGVGLIGVCMGAGTIVTAPLVIRILLGARYGAAVPVLRMFGLLPVLVSVNTVLAFYWALPTGRDKTFLAAIILAGLANVALAVLLVPRWGALGMAAAATAAEVIVLAWLGGMYARHSRVKE